MHRRPIQKIHSTTFTFHLETSTGYASLNTRSKEISFHSLYRRMIRVRGVAIMYTIVAVLVLVLQCDRENSQLGNAAQREEGHFKCDSG